MRINELKMVTPVNLFLVLAVASTLVACGKKKKPSPPAPCGVGVNQACGLQVRGHSAWSTQLTSTQQDPKTKQTIPGSEKKITVTYEFKEAAPKSVWRRTMIIEAADGNTAMFQQGFVKTINSNEIHFEMDLSTCNDTGPHFANQDFTLYYTRHGSSLRIDTQPIVAKPVRGIGDFFGNIMAESIGQLLRTALESAFTFGSARTYLTSGHGSFTLDSKKPLTQMESKNATIGCFSTFGTGFAKSGIRPEW